MHGKKWGGYGTSLVFASALAACALLPSHAWADAEARPSGYDVGDTITISGETISTQVSWFSDESDVTNMKIHITNSVVTGVSLAVYGGFTNAENGKSKDNLVVITDSTIHVDVSGGFATHENTTVEGNKVIVSGSNLYRDLYGGRLAYPDSKAKNNTVVLVGKGGTYLNPITGNNIEGNNITIGGDVCGYSIGTGENNSLEVLGSNITVNNIANFDKISFEVPSGLEGATPMLTVTGTGNTDLQDTSVNVNLNANSATKPEDITLIKRTDAIGKIINFGEPQKQSLTVGSTLEYEATLALADDDQALKMSFAFNGINDNGKSLVETRAAAAAVVNGLADFAIQEGLGQAALAAEVNQAEGSKDMAAFAAVGGSKMRYETGSYVDVKGWNGMVGFAKKVKDATFGVAVEHGRGNYDSYVGSTHAEGDIRSTGGVLFGEVKREDGVHFDAALRAGRVKSDYQSALNKYDESSTYYGFSLGGGKEIAVSDKAKLDVYGRYYFSHTNSSDVKITTGEAVDFDAVDSHRLRLGARYIADINDKAQAYAGLAWQYEFGGDAKAAINGYSAPAPSLQGHSGMLEAGYKLTASSNLTLDFNLNGWVGQQRGLGGGISAQWTF